MRWDDSAGAGFTAAGVRPWLPLPAAGSPNVEAQRADAGSTLWLSKRLLALRHEQLGAGVAEFEPLPASDPRVWAFRAASLVVAANMSGQPAAMPAAAGEVLLSTAIGAEPAGHRDVLRPWEGVITRPAA
jgi:alpha-glucosidase